MKMFVGLIAILLLIAAFVRSAVDTEDVTLLIGLSCFNWITFQAEQIKDKLK